MAELDGVTTSERRYDEIAGSVSSTRSVIPLGVRRTLPDMNVGRRIVGGSGIT